MDAGAGDRRSLVYVTGAQLGGTDDRMRMVDQAIRPLDTDDGGANLCSRKKFLATTWIVLNDIFHYSF